MALAILIGILTLFNLFLSYRLFIKKDYKTAIINGIVASIGLIYCLNFFQLI